MDVAKTEKLLESIFPEVIGAVITVDPSNMRVNLCPVNFQAVSTKYEHPLTVCLGLGNNSYTLKNILAHGQFVYAYPSPGQLKDVIYCGTVSGYKSDKLKDTRLQFTESKKVAPPNLQNAVINFECELQHSYIVGNFTLVVGLVKHLEGSPTETQKIYSLGGTKYGTVVIDKVIQESR